MSKPMTPNSPILGPTDPTATVAAALAYVDSRDDRGPVVNPEAVEAYVRELHRLCLLSGIRFEAAFPQACDECDVFRDERFWGAYGNPVGYGAEETLDRPGEINYTGGRWTPVGAARVHLVHLWLYAAGTTLPESLAPFKELDTR
jgi:hypothetical protein